MIIRSRWRRAGGLAVHLSRTDTNEAVVVRHDLIRDLPGDPRQALAIATAIARTNSRTTRDLIHVKISPSITLDNACLARTLATIEAEHAIGAHVPRIVIEHHKGDRPAHWHVVYPIVDPLTGRAIRSHGNGLRDEIASRCCELDLGERITPGAHHRAVIAALDRRGLGEQAQILAVSAHVMPGRRLGQRTRQHAEALGQDADQAMSDAYDAWQKSAGDAVAFAKACDRMGYVIARGEKAILLLHRATGMHIPVARSLRQKAKQAGQLLDIRERELGETFPDAPSLIDARDTGLETESKAATAAMQRELERLRQEAATDGQHRLAERLDRIRHEVKKRKAKNKATTLAARRHEIREAYARRDRIRRARVGRAFMAAGILDRPDLRVRIAQIAGGAILLAGGGFGLALIAAGVTILVLPTRERARSMAFYAKIARSADRDEQAIAMRQAYKETAARSRDPLSVSIDFRAIDKRHRGLAGARAHLVLEEAEGPLSPEKTALKSAIDLKIGASAEQIERAVCGGAGRGVLTVLGWYDPARADHRAAVETILRVDQPRRRKIPAKTRRDEDRSR